jgi:AcrR family transcriptional regulator
MARTVKEQEYAAKRNEILDAAQRLVYAKGYERMTIQDILADLQISSGAFYHYFDSKPAVLEALAERMQVEMEQQVLPIVRDPQLPADKKLQRFFAVMLRQDLTREQKTLMIALLRIWFADDNTLIRQKVDEGRVARLAPLLTEIVRQGIDEGSFTSIQSELIGEVILSLIEGLQYSLARLYSRFERDHDEGQFVDGNVAVYDGYLDAIERLLGAPSRLLYRLEPGTVREGLVIEAETR